MKKEFQKKNAQHSLHNDHVFKTFFETSPLMMGIADVEGSDIRHVIDNEAAARFFGKEKDFMAGKLASEMGIPNEAIRLWVGYYLLAQKRKTPLQFQYSHQLTKNHEKHFKVTVACIGENQNGDPRFSYIVQDITEEVLSHKEIEYNNERLNEATNTTGVGVWEMNLTTGENWRSHSHDYVFGFDAFDSERDMQFFKSRLLKEDSERMSRLFQEAITKGESFDLEFRFRTPKNEIRWMKTKGRVLRNSEIRIIGTNQDITSEKEIEEKLKHSDEKFKAIANTLPLIIWTATPDGTIDWFNDWFYEYTGLQSCSDWNSATLSPIHFDDLPVVTEIWQQSLKKETAVIVEFRIKRFSDKEYRWHLARGIPVRNSDGKIIKWVGSNTDIHDQKLLVEELQSERELRDRFVAALSHDLRTPLTAAKLNAQILLRKGDNIEFATKAKVKIVECLDRADSMIRDLLDVSRLRAKEKLPIETSECKLNQLLSDIVDNLSIIHGDRFVLKTDYEIKGHWSCNGIRRIIENLCNNAIKYGDHEKPITISAFAKTNWVNIVVHNFGPPIPPEDQEIIFQPFARAENAMASAHKGWGLGLSLVKGIAEAQDGYVTLKSTEKEGTSFEVHLPS